MLWQKAKDRRNAYCLVNAQDLAGVLIALATPLLNTAILSPLNRNLAKITQKNAYRCRAGSFKLGRVEARSSSWGSVS